MLNGGPVDWSSSKQKSVSTSATEAEYKALSQAARSIKYLKGILKSYGYKQTRTQLFADSQGAIQLSSNGKTSTLTKHISVSYHHVRELVNRKYLVLKHISGNLNPAHFLASKTVKSTSEFDSVRQFVLKDVDF